MIFSVRMAPLAVLFFSLFVGQEGKKQGGIVYRCGEVDDGGRVGGGMKK